MTSQQISVLVSSLISAVLNLLLIGTIPLVIYAVVQRWRWKRSWSEIQSRLGLVVGERRYLIDGVAISLVMAGLSVALVYLIPPDIFVHERSPLRVFLGVGLGPYSLLLALLYGGIKTGLSEELLFRGLIAGSLGRRMPLWAANVVQSVIFLFPHLAIIFISPALWWIAIFVPLVAGLVSGWLRLASGSVLGPWIVHAVGNIVTALAVAIKTS